MSDLISRQAVIDLIVGLQPSNAHGNAWQKFRDGVQSISPVSETRRECEWLKDDDGVYRTGCGHDWMFTDGDTAADIGAKFCVYCGGLIKEKAMNIIVNGETKLVGEIQEVAGRGHLDYGSIVSMAGYGPDRILTVTYHTRRKGDEQRQGILAPRETVLIEEGMIFNVADTSNE